MCVWCHGLAYGDWKTVYRNRFSPTLWVQGWKSLYPLSHLVNSLQFSVTIYLLCTCVHMQTMIHLCRSEANLQSQVSPSTGWLLGFEPRWSELAASIVVTTMLRLPRMPLF